MVDDFVGALWDQFDIVKGFVPTPCSIPFLGELWEFLGAWQNQGDIKDFLGVLWTLGELVEDSVGAWLQAEMIQNFLGALWTQRELMEDFVGALRVQGDRPEDSLISPWLQDETLQNFLGAL